MTIRNRLLLLLLPPLTTFLILISFFFYFNWAHEIYETRKTQEQLLTAYSNQWQKEGVKEDLEKIEANLKEIDQRIQQAWLLILPAFCMTLLLVIGTVFLIAERISKPVRQLNQAALEIAAGDYEANIHVEGPKEVVELANTLNTMSQCLVEHMSRLRASSLIRERMYGEYECALLLQYQMLQKVIDDFHYLHLSMRLIATPLSLLQKGLSLKIEHFQEKELILTLLEAQEQGFSGLFELNQWTHLQKEQLKDKAFIECRWKDQGHLLQYETHLLPPPLVWSVQFQRFIKGEGSQIPLQNRDMVFLYNSSLIEQFKTRESVEALLGRVLRHFAEDGIDTIQTMLTNELTFLAKKQHTRHNVKIICLQLKNLPH